MNKKYTVKTPIGPIYSCVLSPDRTVREQIMELFNISGGGGVSVDVNDHEFVIVDYFHGEPIAEFPILSVEDTDLPVSLKWTDEGKK